MNSILSSINKGLKTLFGTINWQKPGWLHWFCQLSSRTRSALTLALIMAVFAGSYATYWYTHLPKPVYTSVDIKVPDITPLAETLYPNPLTLNFSYQDKPLSVAPIEWVGKTVESGIDITPAIKGHWYWNSDNELIFYPEDDWPANQTYTISFAPNALNQNAKLEYQKLNFTTHPFTATIKDLKFYQNPTDANDHGVVATIEFNYPVDAKTLNQYTNLTVQSKPVGFQYRFDTNKREAYLRSDAIDVLDVARYAHLTLNKDITSSTGSGRLGKAQTQNLLIPDTSNVLTITSAKATIVRDATDKPEQVLSIESSIGISDQEFNKAIHVYLLPENYPATANEPEKKAYEWQNPGEVTQDILNKSTLLNKKAIPSETQYSTLHSYRFDSPAPRYLLVSIDKGMKGFGGFTLHQPYRTIVQVPEYPKDISFLHKGSLLALGADQKLSVVVRGLPAVKFDFARVLPDNVNQLVTQTDGDFNNPYFINPSFNQQNIARIFSETKTFNAQDPGKAQYTALDIQKYLGSETNTQGPRGLFLIQATGWDTTNNAALDSKASRLILITDMAMIVKDNQDGTHDVFVQSITQGTPVSGATVSVLGKNGLPLLSITTDANGQAHVPSLNDYVDDRQPTVYTASLNQDVSFIPYNNNSRQLNLTKFDVGGLYSSYQQDNSGLSAYLFSDRGIYRPGDTAHIGIIVKQAFAKPQPAGLPIQVFVVDARGNTLKNETIALNDTGFLSIDVPTTPTSPTGDYTISVYLVKDNLAQNFLGSTNIRVSEFLPDRLKIKADFVPHSVDGWLSPTGLSAKVALQNLYGTPATNRTISGTIILTPQTVSFEAFKEYVFADPLFDPKKPPKSYNEKLKSVTTDAQGIAELNLDLDRFEQATYQLTLFAEGFEAEGGRSVTTQIKTLISPLPYFVGYKPDGDLNFIKQNSARSLQFIAVNPQLQTTDANDLKLQLVSLQPVTSLVKKPDGTYQYQSVMQSKIIDTQALLLTKDGKTYALPTQTIGDYALYVLDKNDHVLSQLKFSVVGDSQQPLAKNAELDVKLDKSDYHAGDTITLQITAPFTGSGLITIERDKVYASQWFKTDSTNSVQTITIPQDFEGNGYVNVAFVRDWNSQELFMNPLTFSIAPFSVSSDKQHLNITLDAAKDARPGEPLVINYSTDKPAQIVIFAVDEGILQVARYTTPNPLAFFFQKRALEVLTQQTVDQILPKFVQERELSAVGGDEGDDALSARLNPFKRKTDKPVAFWSGMLTADPTSRQVAYNIPDYFNGSLQIMAVAVSLEGLGAVETHTKVKGDFIINPNVPTFVAPGDEFEVSASIANNLKNSGDAQSVTVELTTSPEITIAGTHQQTLVIPEGQEKTVRFKLKATQNLGSASLHFKASTGDKSANMEATLSVRPASPYKTTLQSGQNTTSQWSLKLKPSFYEAYYKAEAMVSSSPMIFVLGLERFMEDYPYGCTEQLTSKAMPLIALKSQPWYPGDLNALDDHIKYAIQNLAQRQMSTGGFSYWPGYGSDFNNQFASVYAMHFLTEARAQGFEVNPDMFANGLGYLRDLAGQNPKDTDAARVQAYAIYVLTRNEIVTTNYITHLLGYYQNSKTPHWQEDIAAVYLAASFQLLQNSDDARQLLNQFKSSDTVASSDFYNNALRDAQYLYLIAKHFPDRLEEVSKSVIPRLIQAMNDNQFNTLLSGYASLALGSFDTPMMASEPAYSITTYDANQKKTPIPAAMSGFESVSLAQDITQVDILNPKKSLLFYSVLQSGFDKTLPSESQSNGIELSSELIGATDAIFPGDELEVHIKIRAAENRYLTNTVIEALLPGGFEVVQDSVKNNYLDYFDVREDRINFFLTVDEQARELIFKIKATNPGVYTLPAIYAESMYDPHTFAHTKASTITVQPHKEDPKMALVDVTALSQTQSIQPIKAHLKYATKQNFVGQIIDGYSPDAKDFALLTPKAAEALCKVQNELVEHYGYGLLILDAYRPKRAVMHFVRWSKLPAQDNYELTRKQKHYPNIDKNQLFSLGYVVEDSSHTYGNTVDVVLIDLKTMKLLPMGARFDYMDAISGIHTGPETIGEEAYKNRQILAQAMLKYDFEPYEEEFWHFSHGGIEGREVQVALDIPVTKELKGSKG